MSKKKITVNGILLDEYLKDAEAISSEIEGKKLIEDINQNFKNYYKPRVRYKSKKEKHGEVKILNQRELNQTMRTDQLIKHLRDGNYKNFIITELICGDNTPITNTILKKLAIKLSKQYSISMVKHPDIAIRREFERIINSEFGRLINITNTAGRVKRCRLNENAYKKIKLENAIMLSNYQKNNGGNEINELIKNLSKSENYGEEYPLEENSSPQHEEQQEIKVKPLKLEQPMEDSIDEVLLKVIVGTIAKVKGIKNLRSLANFDGDLNINIYINNKEE